MVDPLESPAIIPVTYDGEVLQRLDLGIVLVLSFGLWEPPTVRGQDVRVPHLDGLQVRPRRVERRDIGLKGWVAGTGADGDAIRGEFTTRMRWLNELFHPARAVADLVAGPLPDGSTWTIAARPVDNGPPIVLAEDIGLEYVDVSIGLYSVAPEWTIEEAP